MGALPLPAPPPRLNVDRFGMPRDYATYMWVTYRKHVADRSPERLAFLFGPPKEDDAPSFGLQMVMR